ncbi:MAG TPA: proline--tRNA ligase [Bryobacteraceae bacterium]|nr:proline--tRNA ligase [Bryobacteraceae bacterium]
MRWSKLFIPTLRENPAEAEVASHQLLLRAGYVRQLSAGLYSYLYLAQRSMNKIMRIVREEMDAIGAQEMFLPALHPAEIWQESGRWDVMGDNMFRLKDRFQRELCLGMTHEEVMTSIARGELRSYKQLPQLWYQIQTKFRDEPRPKSGLVRVRQFLMKDSYSFDVDAAGLDVSYQKHYDAYCRIFDRCGLKYTVVEAHSGAMGGSQSHEFMVASDAGEDLIAIGPDYAANLEKAVSRPVPPAVADAVSGAAIEEFHTPGRKTIEEVSTFDGMPATSHIKSLLQIADGVPVMVLLRGDHQLNEAKLASVLAASDVRAARPDEIREWLGADAGSLGPVGVEHMKVITDAALGGRSDLVAGANKDDYHLRHVTPGRDFRAEFHDVRQVAVGDTDLSSGAPLQLVKSMEIGHIFKLGYKYSDSMKLRVLDEHGKEVTPIMGSYGIGVERILCAAIELFHDTDGMIMPPSIAPFQVIISPVNIKDAGLREAAEKLYAECRDAGLDPLLDDRDERPGVKFKDSDLIGVPFRITVGKKLAQGMVELLVRNGKQTMDVPVAEAAAKVKSLIGLP